MKFNWFCYDNDTPYDPKLTFIAKKVGARRCEITAVWDCIMSHASKNHDRGYVGDIDLEIIADAQQIDHAAVETLHRCIVEKGLIVGGYIKNWEKYQQTSNALTSTERSRKYREKQKQEQELREKEILQGNGNATDATLQQRGNGIQYSTVHTTTLLSKEDARSEFQRVYDFGSAAFQALATSQTTAIQQWIAAGCSPELDIIPEIERQLKAGKTVKSWSYLTGGIMDAKATREAPLPSGKPRKSNQQKSPEPRKGAMQSW